MPLFRMTDPCPRVYFDLGVVEPGEEIEAATNPDPAHFEQIQPTPVAALVAPESGPEPTETQEND